MVLFDGYSSPLMLKALEEFAEEFNHVIDDVIVDAVEGNHDLRKTGRDQTT
jgi:hypothetical protein